MKGKCLLAYRRFIIYWQVPMTEKQISYIFLMFSCLLLVVVAGHGSRVRSAKLISCVVTIWSVDLGWGRGTFACRSPDLLCLCGVSHADLTSSTVALAMD
jgi:hypothetical protein